MNQTYKSHVFSLEGPTNFKCLKEDYASIWLRDDTPNSSIQNPTIRVALQRLSAYDEPKDGTLAERFYKMNLDSRFKAETVECIETKLHGQNCYIHLLQTNDSFQGQPLALCYYFAMVELNENYVVEMLCDVLTENWKSYLPQFEALWNSLTFDTDIAKCEEAEALYDEHLTTLMKQDREDDEAQRKKAKQKWLDAYIDKVEKTNQNIFQIGNYEFDIVWDKAEFNHSKWLINSNFSCEIVARAKQVEELKKEKVISDYNDTGELKIQFNFQGIYQNNLPRAEFFVNEDKVDIKQNNSFYFQGRHYHLMYFDGKIFIDKKGVKIFGNLNDGLYKSRQYPVNIQVAFDAKDLDWDKYTFTTIEELETAPSELVRSIFLKDSIKNIPEAFKVYKNLNSLMIGHRYNQEDIGLLALPDWISELENLEYLNITSPVLSELPESIANLQKLTKIFIFNTRLQTLPDSIWQMPSLEHLSLENNQLTDLPDVISLPNLRSLRLKGNQLKTLPQSIAKLPKLEWLYLSRNPWEFVPSSIDEIKSVDLEIEYKRQFFDYDYLGADGKGNVVWDDEVFYAKNDSELMQSIHEYWKDELVQPYREDLSQLMKTSIIFSLDKEENYEKLGNHRIGGMPDLPKDIAYPRFGKNWREEKEDYIYEFITQINCTDIAHLQDYLPRTGMLYFFLTTIHDVYDSSNAVKVIYSDNDAKMLKSGKHFDFTKDDYSEAFDDIAYSGYQASAQKFVDLPDLYPIRQNEYLLEGLSETFKKEIEEDRDSGYVFTEAFEGFVKKGVAVNSYGFSQHEYPEHEVALTHKGKPQDWIILLRVPSVGSFQWGDAGDLFFVIHKSDLAKQDFSNVICTMYSS